MDFSDPHTPYVAAAYGATALILGGLIWASLAASARSRRALDEIDRKDDP